MVVMQLGSEVVPVVAKNMFFKTIFGFLSQELIQYFIIFLSNSGKLGSVISDKLDDNTMLH